MNIIQNKKGDSSFAGIPISILILILFGLIMLVIIGSWTGVLFGSDSIIVKLFKTLFR